MTDKEQREVFSNNLNYFIKRSGKSQKELAEILDVPYTTFNSWCVGRVIPPVRTVHKLADYFGCSFLELVNPRSDKSVLISQIEYILQNKDESFLKRMLSYAEYIAKEYEEKEEDNSAESQCMDKARRQYEANRKKLEELEEQFKAARALLESMKDEVIREENNPRP